MRLPFLFARRYLFSRKSHSVINIVSAVSSLTVAVPVMAMVILLSAFNGLDSLIKSMYRNFDPDIVVTPARGKVFDAGEWDGRVLAGIEGVEGFSLVLEENVLFEYRENTYVGKLRGVDSVYREVIPIESMVVRGEYRPRFGELDQILVGRGMAYELRIDGGFLDELTMYVPRRGRGLSLLPVEFYRSRSAFVSGFFALDQETDGQYAIGSIDFARRLLDYDDNTVSAVFVKITDGADPVKVRERISAAVGPDFRVLTRYQQKESLYRLMQYEKWGIYIIVLMVLVIASFSVIGSLIMIIVDKKKDTETLWTIGAEPKFVRRIFISVGLLISGMGMGIGLLLGLGICLLQMRYGFVEMSGTTFLIDAYPVEIKGADLAGIVLSVGVVNYLISRLTVAKLLGKTARK